MASFKSVCLNQSTQRRIFQEIFEKKKNVDLLLLALCFGAFQLKKIIENYNSVGARVFKVEPIVSCPSLTFVSPIFGQREKIKYISKISF